MTASSLLSYHTANQLHVAVLWLASKFLWIIGGEVDVGGSWRCQLIWPMSLHTGLLYGNTLDQK